ncbi:MAG: hypothetical protein ACU0CO_12615, partial [Shimia sp.]
MPVPHRPRNAGRTAPRALPRTLIGAAATATLTALPAPALSQETGWAGMVAFDKILTAMLQGAVISARSVADLTYDGLAVTDAGTRATITGLQVIPILEEDVDCTIDVDRMDLTLSGWGEIDDLRLTIDVLALEADQACLPADMAPIAAALGDATLFLNTATFDIAYHVPSAGAEIA